MEGKCVVGELAGKLELAGTVDVEETEKRAKKLPLEEAPEEVIGVWREVGGDEGEERSEEVEEEGGGGGEGGVGQIGGWLGW